MGTFEPVDPSVDFVALERRVLEFWREARVFEQSLKLREGGPRWIFYEGPPTANGKPGIHHVESRTFKDVYPRYRTMTGHYVRRKAGWDCHGLPVELEVEKEIGTKTKRDIEAFGVAEFNRLCRESVTRYVDEWERLTERIGFWLDLSDAYFTMSSEYIETVWWSLKQLHERGLLFEDYKSVAYCPRCGTGLSDAEVALGYAHVVDPSVFVKFRVTEPSSPALAGASILAWTTTPWTLPSNEGLAVEANQTYVVVEVDGEPLVLAETLRDAVLGEEARVVDTVPGSALDGTRYEPLYPNVEGAHRVVTADFVLMNEGTGVVHIAPGYGSDDLELGRREGWPIFNPIDDAGRFTDQAPGFVRGLFVKEADPRIVEDLRERGFLLRAEEYEHTYPLCWRCDTPLLYVARTSWYIRTTAKKDRLLAVNESVNWYPDYIKHGRYGDWLENNVDWALSRERYWGTPLPIWRCGAAHTTLVGSLRELSDLAGRDVTGIDPHRPAVDEVEITCPQCGEAARRVPEVIDTWYDSGAMPYAQWGFHPELGRGLPEFEESFPADFISEAIDQTRGWFYSLMAESTLLFDQTSYRNVVCLGLLVDIDGRKMSKRLGNSIDPWEVVDTVGADATRWFLLTGGSPWSDRRTNVRMFQDVVRQFLLTLWNVYSFFVTYANADGFDPAAQGVPVHARPPLDRWVISRLHRLVSRTGHLLEHYDATAAGRYIEHFVDDLSNWYVRRARRRFWDPARGGDASDKHAAYLTLHECLVTTAKLLAPFTPFVAEELWLNLAAGRDGAPESVHLSEWPAASSELIEDSLEEAMDVARQIVALGRTVRTEGRARVRQPLARAVVHYGGDRAALEPVLDLVADELNVKQVEFSERAEELGRWRAKPNFRLLGPRLGERVKAVAGVLAADDGTIAGKLARGETVSISVEGGDPVVLDPADVDLTQETPEGWGVSSEAGVTVALDLDIDEELRLEGVAREVIRAVQDARKAAGLDVSDRIALGMRAEGDLARAIERHGSTVAAETLAVELSLEAIPDAPYRGVAEIEGAPLTVTLAKRQR